LLFKTTTSRRGRRPNHHPGWRNCSGESHGVLMLFFLSFFLSVVVVVAVCL